MATLVPIEGDPFASASATPPAEAQASPEQDQQQATGTLIPVDHDPFASASGSITPNGDLETRRAQAAAMYEKMTKDANQQKPWYQNLGEGLGRGAERGTLGLLQAFNLVNPDDARDVAKQTRIAGEGTGIAGGIGEIALDPRMAGLLATGPMGWAARAGVGGAIGWTDPTESNSPMQEGAGNAVRDAAAFAALPPAISALGTVATRPMATLQKGLANLTGIDAAKYAAFKAAQIDPTLGDVSDSPVVQRFQDILKNVPFASKIINKGEANVRSGIESGLADAGYDSALERASGGDALKKGLNTYVTRGKSLFDKAYSGFDKQYQLADEMTPAATTMSKIQEIQSRAKTPEALDQYLSPTEQKLMGNFEDAAGHAVIGDTPNISYNDLKLFRTSIGKKLADYTIGSSEKGALRELYGAMTDDMRQTVVAKGGEKAGQAFDRLNSQYSKFQTNLDNNINGIINKPEVTQMLTAVRQGVALPDKTAAIMRALPQEQREVVRGSLIKEMGMNRTQAGGGEFDPVRFAGNFSKLDPAAQDAMMTGMDNATRTKFRAVLDSARSAKETSLQGNPSGTSKSQNLTNTTIGLVAAPKTTLGLLSVGNVSARMMTYPPFIEWLSKAPAQLTTNPTRALGMLGAIATAAHSDNAAADDLDAYHQELTSQFYEKMNPGAAKGPQGPMKINISKDPNIGSDGLPKINLPKMGPTSDNKIAIPSSFQQAESSRQMVYKDKTGHHTVGVGFNMDNPAARHVWGNAGVHENFDAVRNGKSQLSQGSVQKLLATSYNIARNDIQSLIPHFDKLKPHQQEALTHLAFQYGKPRLKEALPGVLAMANQGNGPAAAARLMASDYAKKYNIRARALAHMLYNNAPYKEG